MQLDKAKNLQIDTASGFQIEKESVTVNVKYSPALSNLIKIMTN
jgi:hypothetical protein